MSKRPFGHGDLKRMSDFKAIAMDYAYYATLGDEGRLYCLTDKQVYILLAQLDYVGWLTRWYNTEDITQKTLGFIQSELMEALMSCVDISVLVDQGKLNLTRNVQQQQIESQRLRDAYEDEYDGSPTSINPDAPTVNFGATGQRYEALCAALMAYVYQAASAQIQAIVAGDVAAFALIAGAAILLIPGLNLFYLAGAALALIAGGGIIGVATGTAVAALQDTAALDNVVCYMRDQLKSLSVTQANFAACLDSYPFSTGSHEAIVCDFLKGQLGTNYLPFLDMLGQGYSGVINGEPLPSCPCPEPDCFEFGIDEQGWIPVAGGWAQYTTGVGWGQNGAQPYVQISLTGIVEQITTVRVRFSRAWTGATVNPDYDKFYIIVAGGPGSTSGNVNLPGAPTFLTTGQEIDVPAQSGMFWTGSITISTIAGGNTWPGSGGNPAAAQYIDQVCFNP